MKAFVSLKFSRGDNELEQLALMMQDTIRQAGYEAFVASREIASQGLTNPKDFMPFVRQQVEDCDLMIVLYHPDLRGGLVELGLAFARGIPIWLCHKPCEKISTSALGCTELTLEYSSLADLRKKLLINLEKTKEHK